MYKIGDEVKDFTLLDGDGNAHTLSSYLGKKVVIYFYPKDNTPGCTTQACEFRDNYHEIKKNNVMLFGVSTDDAKSHQKFSEKYNLPFTLLTDPDGEVAYRFGAFGEKLVFGRTIMGMIRSTFIIDEEGKLEKAWPNANSKTNASEVVAYLNSLK